MTTNNTLRQLAASTAVAMAFSPMAQAADSSVHPILNPATGATAYSARLSIELVKAAGNDMASLRAKGFVVELEAALKEPSEKTRIVVYPKDNSTNMLVVAAVVPPKGMEQLPIPVCAQQFGRPLAAWNITAKGDVVPRPVLLNPEGSTRPACNATIVAARAEIEQQMASGQPTPQPAQPPPGEKVASAEQAKPVVYPNFGQRPAAN